MGKGDKKSKKGKIFMGSYGKSRPKAANKGSVAAAVAPAAPTETKKTAVKKASKKAE